MTTEISICTINIMPHSKEELGLKCQIIEIRKKIKAICHNFFEKSRFLKFLKFRCVHD